MSLLLLFSAAVTAATEPTVAAQGKLATLLASADSIDAVAPLATGVAFAIARGGEAYRITVGTHGGEVVSVMVDDLGRASAHRAGAFSWLRHELPAGAALTALTVAPSGTVIAVTAAGAHYALLAGRDGNIAVSARWAAAWDEPSDG